VAVDWKKIVREPNIWIGVALTLIVIPILIYAIIKHETTPIAEADWQMVSLVPTTQGRHHLTPRYHHDKCLWSVVGDKTVRADYLKKAVEAWDSRVCEGLNKKCVYLCVFDDPDLFFRTEEKSQARFGNIFVSVETLPDDGHGGITNNIYDEKTGEVYYSVVRINHVHTYHEDSYVAALTHEIGHGLLLDHCDDRHTTSIMRKKLNTRGRITDHDAELLRNAWNSQRN